MNRHRTILITIVALAIAAWGAVSIGQGRRPGPPWGGRGGPAEVGSDGLSSAPIGKSEAEKRILAVLDDMDQTQRQGHEPNVQREEGRVLRLLTESIGARHVVEIGTANGYSTIWLCLGLQATGGKLTTYEIDPRIAAIARAVKRRLGVHQPMGTQLSLI
jgi:hypothetical protein